MRAVGSRWCVYMVLCSDGSLYTGCTNDLAKRVQAHNLGQGAAYTRSRRPVELVYSSPAGNRSLAQSKEARLKQLARKEKEALIERSQKRQRKPRARARGASKKLAAPESDENHVD